MRVRFGAAPRLASRTARAFAPEVAWSYLASRRWSGVTSPSLGSPCTASSIATRSSSSIAARTGIARCSGSARTPNYVEHAQAAGLGLIVEDAW